MFAAHVVQSIWHGKKKIKIKSQALGVVLNLLCLHCQGSLVSATWSQFDRCRPRFDSRAPTTPNGGASRDGGGGAGWRIPASRSCPCCATACLVFFFLFFSSPVSCSFSFFWTVLGDASVALVPLSSPGGRLSQWSLPWSSPSSPSVLDKATASGVVGRGVRARLTPIADSSGSGADECRACPGAAAWPPQCLRKPRSPSELAPAAQEEPAAVVIVGVGLASHCS
jgi:hypothetical protein